MASRRLFRCRYLFCDLRVFNYRNLFERSGGFFDFKFLQEVSDSSFSGLAGHAVGGFPIYGFCDATD